MTRTPRGETSWVFLYGVEGIVLNLSNDIKKKLGQRVVA